MSMIFFEDLSIGDTHEFGNKLVLREEVIDFAKQFDPQPFHLDDEAAAKTHFGKLCASGWHTCAMTMRLLVDDLMDRKMAGAGSPGIDRIRWRRPVFPGDRLRVRTTVLEKHPKDNRPDMGLMLNQIEVFNQDDIVVMTLVSRSLVMRREPA